MSKVNKIVKAIEVKTIFLGESGVGKTNLIRAAIDEEFEEGSKSTSMASCVEKSVKVDKKYYSLKLWDTIGQEKLRSMAKIFYKGAKIVIFVYDITTKKTFEELEYWVNEVKNSLGDEPICAIVGNKSDLIEEEEVDENTAREYAFNKELKFKIVSAKTNPKDFQLFLDELLNDFIQKYGGKIKDDQVIEIARETVAEKKKSWC
jgi:small GTP-binding protein